MFSSVEGANTSRTTDLKQMVQLKSIFLSFYLSYELTRFDIAFERLLLMLNAGHQMLISLSVDITSMQVRPENRFSCLKLS